MKMHPFINPLRIFLLVWTVVKVDGEARELLRRLKVDMGARSYGDTIRRLAALYVKYRLLEESFPDVAKKVEDMYSELRRLRRLVAKQASQAIP